jgi:hypothetical protein
MKRSEPVRTYAQNVLEANGLLKYYEPILLPDELKSASEKLKLRTSTFENGAWMRIFPNPARQYVIVEYNLSKELYGRQGQIVFSISTSEGKIIETKLLLKTQDQFLVNTTN